MPPTAAIIGNNACFILDNSPCRNSLLISKVTKKKNIAINASLIQCKADSFKPKLFIPIKIYLFRLSKYNDDIEELLIISAAIALINKINPLAASSLKNHLKGEDKYLSIFYLIKSNIKSLISSIVWYKLFSKNLIFGKIISKLSLKVSRISINAIIDIITTKRIFKKL